MNPGLIRGAPPHKNLLRTCGGNAASWVLASTPRLWKLTRQLQTHLHCRQFYSHLHHRTTVHALWSYSVVQTSGFLPGEATRHFWICCEVHEVLPKFWNVGSASLLLVWEVASVFRFRVKPLVGPISILTGWTAPTGGARTTRSTDGARFTHTNWWARLTTTTGGGQVGQNHTQLVGQEPPHHGRNNSEFLGDCSKASGILPFESPLDL